MHEGSTLISLIGSVIGSNENITIPEDTDFELLYKLCAIQDMANVAAYGLEKTNAEIPENCKKAFERAKNIGIMRCASQEAELEVLSHEFEKAGILHMPLKGSTYRDIYPSADMRTSADIDIFIDEKKSADVEDIMLSQGYTKTDDGLTVDVYEKKPIISIEIHKKITKDEKNAPACLLSGYDGYIKCDGCEHTYKMSDEDSFVYMVWHYAKHFRTAGAGIRHAADIYLFEKKRSGLNFDYIKSELERIKLYGFYQKMKPICKIWFENEPATDMSREITDYVLRSGIFGTRENAVALGIAVSGGKSKRILRRFFPSIIEMKGEFKILRKHIYLLPIFYIVRIFKKIFLSKSAATESSALSKVDSGRAEKTKNLLSDMGLI